MTLRARARARWPRIGGSPLRGRLGRRLLGWFLVFSLVPLFLSNALGYVRSIAIVEDLIEDYVGALARVEAKHIRSQIERNLLDLQTIAAGNEFLASGAWVLAGEPAGAMVGVADLASVEQQLGLKRAGLRVFEALYLTDPAGRVLASTGIIPGGGPPPVPAEAGSVLLERLDREPAPAGPFFHMMVPVTSFRGAMAGYLGGVIGRDGFADLLEIPNRLAGSVESYIVDARGLPLFVSHPGQAADYTIPLALPVLSAEPGTFVRYADPSGSAVVAISVPVEGLPWRYVAEAPVANALAPLHTLRHVSIVAGTALGVILVVMAWVVAGGIVAPVRRLVTATRRVGQGDLDVRVEAHENDEIGELSGAFNEMAADLAESRARVEKLHQREIGRASQLATVGELASGVAHEIKNPLAGIAGGMDLLLRRVGDDETLAPIAEEMTRQLARIEAAVRDLLSYARPSSPTLAPVSPLRILQRTTRLVQPAADRAGVRLTIGEGAECEEALLDEELILQALVNLVMNAVQATPAGGAVEVRASRSGDSLWLEVSDTGRGVPHGEREHIFKPFYTTRHSGTGLGLSITREVVERHGGRVELESEMGRGSTFRLVLPCRSAAPSLAAQGAVP